MQLGEAPVKLQMNGTSTAGTGPDLAGFPGLVYAPTQWGEGVRCGSNGQDALSVAQAVDAVSIGVAAATAGVSLNEALDSYKWAKKQGLI
jgi:hypothetical protein